jgi:hypothetical protein
MSKQEPTEPSEIQQELDGTSLLKSIPKYDILQAPEGYFDRLNLRIIDRVADGNTRTPLVRTLLRKATVRWVGVAAIICISFLAWHVSNNEIRNTAVQHSHPLPLQAVELSDSAIIESVDIQTIDEHVLADELLSFPQQMESDSLILHQKVTEYLLVHADHDLLIESL